ncbi:hypothetical protein [Hyphomicrobium facile]|uniref:ABC transmembrane type-1 domain-containing protein n=1 Tax=Hyphomicrobium facile TaxID=51670 RepID=A0A1I7NPY2_9HYPH|nr:hypothetical protein [Hyphomicrobium facile]SFV36741.1 hypothetical protein SAMN04488557_2723 [Hyphomicrobium facile]
MLADRGKSIRPHPALVRLANIHRDVERSFKSIATRDSRSERQDRAVHALTLWRLAAKRTLAGVAAFSIFANLLMLAIPIYSFRMADRALSGGGIDPLVMLPGLTLGMLAMMSMLDILRRRPLSRLGTAMETVLGSAILSALLMSASERDGGQMLGLRSLHKLRAFLSSPTMLLLFDVPLTPLFFTVIYLIDPGLGSIALIAGLAVLSAALFKNTLALWIVRIAAPAAIVGWGVHLMLAGSLTAGMMIAASIIAGRALRTLADAIEGREYVVQAWAEYVRVCMALESGRLSNTEEFLLPVPVAKPHAANVLAFRKSAAKRRHIAISC